MSQVRASDKDEFLYDLNEFLKAFQNKEKYIDIYHDKKFEFIKKWCPKEEPAPEEKPMSATDEFAALSIRVTDLEMKLDFASQYFGDIKSTLEQIYERK